MFDTTPSELIVAVMVAGPPEEAVAFSVMFPSVDTVQKLLVGVEYVMYEAGKLLLKFTAMLYVPASVIFFMDVGMLALRVAVTMMSDGL